MFFYKIHPQIELAYQYMYEREHIALIDHNMVEDRQNELVLSDVFPP